MDKELINKMITSAAEKKFGDFKQSLEGELEGRLSSKISDMSGEIEKNMFVKTKDEE